MEHTELPLDQLPTWRRIVAFPLVSLVIALAAAIGTVLATAWLITLIPEGTLAPVPAMALSAVASVLALFVVMKVLVRHLGEMPRDDLPLASALPQTGAGLLAGGWLITMCVGIAWVLGVYMIDGWGGSESAAMIFLQAGLVAGFVEEVLLRGILFRFVEEFAGSWIALLISSLAFGFLHHANDNATLFSSIAIAIEAGILLGAAYMYTRSLWLAVGIHAGWNVVQGYIWDVPVSGFQVDGLVDARLEGSALLSGGAFGLEASVIALVVATAAGIWLLREAEFKGHFVAPRWVRRRG